MSFFPSCLVDQFFPQVGLAAVELLERFGVEVEFDNRQTCCGQPAFNSGFKAEARSVARRFVEVFEGAEAIVFTSGSCATMAKLYLPELLQDEGPGFEVAERLSERIFELSDFMVSVLKVEDTGSSFRGSVTFHDSCHQLRELGIAEQPRALLKNVQGVKLIEMQDSTRCCGFGGTFSVKFSELSSALGRDKVKCIEATGAEYVIANDVSCLMHIEGLLKRSGSSVKTMHLAELLVK